jgi:hypothetical protein
VARQAPGSRFAARVAEFAPVLDPGAARHQRGRAVPEQV